MSTITKDEVFLYIDANAAPTVTLAQLRVFFGSHSKILTMLLAGLVRSSGALKLYTKTDDVGVTHYWSPDTNDKAIELLGAAKTPVLPHPYAPPKLEEVDAPAVQDEGDDDAEEEEAQSLATSDCDEPEVQASLTSFSSPAASKEIVMPPAAIKETERLAKPLPVKLGNKPGGLNRGKLTGVVAMVMFIHRDKILTVNDVARICPKLKVVDVRRILSQLSSVNHPSYPQYFKRVSRHTMEDQTTGYQWGPLFAYPFKEPILGDEDLVYHDGKRVAPQPAVPTLYEDPPEEGAAQTRGLISDETKMPPSPLPVTTDVDSIEIPYYGAPANLPQAEATTGIYTQTVGAEGKPTLAEASRFVDTYAASKGVVSGELTVAASVSMPFKGTFDTEGHLTVYRDGSSVVFSKEETQKLINLLGPHYVNKATNIQ